MNCNISKIIKTPEERVAHLQYLLEYESLTKEKIMQIIDDYKLKLDPSKATKGNATVDFLDEIVSHMERTGIVESDSCCYSGLGLTGVTDPEKQKLLKEDHQLIKQAIAGAGLRIYDPAEAPFNPQHKMVGEPVEVSDLDLLLVVASKYFSFTNLAPSSGGGMEERTANMYNKYPFVFVKRDNFVSRMTTGARRVIVVEYDDMKAQKDEVTGLISMLREYEIGVGDCRQHGNTLVGFKDGKTICLPGLVQEKFPHFTYDFARYK